MNSSIFLPKRINVGFVKRADTYTGNLAFIIYYDNKNVLRQEKSRDGWRDKTIDPIEFNNVPTEGFVINKKVGDYKSDWNHRMAHIRIYDPRGFEFEITVDNLLYILTHANSYKGKGLDGEFIYGWDGPRLTLIPTSSPDYIELVEFNSVLNKPAKFTAKNIILGATYLTKQNESWIYLGRFFDYSDHRKPLSYFFIDKNSGDYNIIKSLSNKIIQCNDPGCASDYAELLDELEHHEFYSPIDHGKDEYVRCTPDEIIEQYNLTKYNYYKYFYIFRDIDTYDAVNIHNHHISYYKYDPSTFTQQVRTDLNSLSISEIILKYKFYKLNRYLKNGKLYHGGRCGK